MVARRTSLLVWLVALMTFSSVAQAMMEAPMHARSSATVVAQASHVTTSVDADEVCCRDDGTVNVHCHADLVGTIGADSRDVERPRIDHLTSVQLFARYWLNEPPFDPPRI